MIHQLPIRVYYEDTDTGQVVFYANYLKFIERGRSEMVRAMGVDQKAMLRDLGMIFVVRRVEADYLKPAVFDDQLVVETQIVKLGGARVEFAQRVLRGEEVLFTAQVVVVCVGQGGRPVRLTAENRRLFEQAQA